ASVSNARAAPASAENDVCVDTSGASRRLSMVRVALAVRLARLGLRDRRLRHALLTEALLQEAHQVDDVALRLRLAVVRVRFGDGVDLAGLRLLLDERHDVV